MRGRVVSAFEAEQERWFLWVPVLFAAGIAAYFALPLEPTLFLASLPAALALVLARVWRVGGMALLVTSAALAIALGFATTKVRSDRVAAPVIDRPIGPVEVTGWIELVEPRPERGQRLTVRVATMDRLAREQWPARIRIRTLAPAAMPLAPGDAVRFSAMLSPPSGPALPDGFDFARSAWFQGLGAVGYTRQPVVSAIIERAPDLDLVWRSRLERVRQAIGARIVAALPGEAGAIANALITGERGAITDTTNAAFRDSGLFHIMSISGLHMVIIAGSVFVSVRFGLALVPVLALRFPIKKWAASAASVGALGYLLISGATTPTVRSWIMISIMYLAVLLDRPAVALRNVALAALAILVIWPESLIDVGFQMSFAAVIALVAAYEAIRDRDPDGEGLRGRPVWQVLALFGGIVLSTLIASVAVAPFAAFHFHVSQQYAILANLIAIPICNIVVMPAALATLVAMPFGLEAWLLMVMGAGIDAMVWCAVLVAALPGAVARLPAFSGSAFALMVAGGFWLALWRRRWRVLGLIPVLVGLGWATRLDPPDILVGRGGRLVAARAEDGRLTAIGDKSGQFELGRWLEHDGDARPPEKAFEGRLFRCDWTGCLATVRGQRVSVNKHAAALRDDCASDILIVVGRRVVDCAEATGVSELSRHDGSDRPARANSGTPAAISSNQDGRETSARRWQGHARLVLQEPQLSNAGAHAIRLRLDGTIDVRTVAQARGQRPWTPPPERRATASSTREPASPPLRSHSREPEGPSRLLDDDQ